MVNELGEHTQDTSSTGVRGPQVQDPVKRLLGIIQDGLKTYNPVDISSKSGDIKARIGEALACFADVTENRPEFQEIKFRIVALLAGGMHGSETHNQIMIKLEQALLGVMARNWEYASSIEYKMNIAVFGIKKRWGIKETITVANMESLFAQINMDAISPAEVANTLDEIKRCRTEMRSKGEKSRLSTMYDIICKVGNRTSNRVEKIDNHLSPREKVGRSLGIDIDTSIGDDNCYEIFDNLPLQNLPPPELNQIIENLKGVLRLMTFKGGNRYDFLCRAITRLRSYRQHDKTKYPSLREESLKSIILNAQEPVIITEDTTQKGKKNGGPIKAKNKIQVIITPAERQEAIQKKKNEIEEKLKSVREGTNFLNLSALNIVTLRCESLGNKQELSDDDRKRVKQKLEEIEEMKQTIVTSLAKIPERGKQAEKRPPASPERILIDPRLLDRQTGKRKHIVDGL